MGMYNEAFMMDLDSMIKLMVDFINGNDAVDKFSDSYLHAFSKIAPEEMDQELFHILEDLFEDIDSYSPMWTSEDEAGYPYRITENALRGEAGKSLLALEDYIKRHRTNQLIKPASK